MHLHSTPFRLLFLTALLATASLFTACKREPVFEICQDPRCQQYETTWRQMLQSRNGMSDAWFEEHIHIIHTEIGQQPGLGESFEVWYNINIDWVRLQAGDNFVIQFDAAAPDSIHGLLPTGVDLDATQIGMAVDSFLLGSGINTIAPVEALAYDTELGARRALEHKTGQSLRDFSLILGVRNGNIPVDGHVRLMAEHGRRDSWNCERAMIDLVTTGTRTYKIACGYY